MIMNVYDIISKYGKGKGEDVMWKSTKVISDFLYPMKETNKHEYWKLMREVYGIMSNGHYNEEFAMHDVSDIEYTNRKGEKKEGAYWTIEQVEEATKTMAFPSSVNKWDKWVAFNMMRADLCKDMEDADIIKATYAFFFKDEDWKPNSSTKVWDYAACKYAK